MDIFKSHHLGDIHPSLFQKLIARKILRNYSWICTKLAHCWRWMEESFRRLLWDIVKQSSGNMNNPKQRILQVLQQNIKARTKTSYLSFNVHKLRFNYESGLIWLPIPLPLSVSIFNNSLKLWSVEVGRFLRLCSTSCYEICFHRSLSLIFQLTKFQFRAGKTKIVWE